MYGFNYQPKAPSSALVSLYPGEDLSVVDTVLRSDYVAEQLAARWLKISWYAIIDEDNAGNRGNLFEAYLRQLFASKETKLT